MQKHVDRVVRFGWLPLIAMVVLLGSDVKSAVVNADLNIAAILNNFGWSRPPQHLATYLWERPLAVLIFAILLFPVGAGLSYGLERIWCIVVPKSDKLPDPNEVSDGDMYIQHHSGSGNNEMSL